jgi:hypothetical protein
VVSQRHHTGINWINFKLLRTNHQITVVHRVRTCFNSRDTCITTLIRAVSQTCTHTHTHTHSITHTHTHTLTHIHIYTTHTHPHNQPKESNADERYAGVSCRVPRARILTLQAGFQSRESVLSFRPHPLV